MTPQAQAWIDERKSGLVAAAEQYVERSGIVKAKISDSQLRNLLNVAQSEQSLKVLINFLRYQIGRGAKGWPHPASGRELESVVTRVAGGCSEEDASRLGIARRELEATLAALFLGYVLREYKYVSSMSDGGKEKT